MANIKSSLVLSAVWCTSYDFDMHDEFICEECNTKDTWLVMELLWSEEDGFFITPCCHSEAIVTLSLLHPREDEDIARQDKASYRFAVTGR